MTSSAAIQGMSHYLEHMLFMGSEKFPDENDYDSYLQHNGGAANAYTEMVLFPLKWCAWNFVRHSQVAGHNMGATD